MDHKKLLLSDLLYLYKITQNQKYIDEVKERMIFCGFTDSEINEFILFENKIIESNEKKYDKCIMDNYYIIGKDKKDYIFKDISMFKYNPDSDNKKTLLISETLAIIDEAIFLTYSNKINNYKAKDEIINLSLENSSNWVYYEFRNRIEYICRCANHIVDGPDYAFYNDKKDILYENEMQICMSRWGNIDVKSRNFIPYTEEYFN